MYIAFRRPIISNTGDSRAILVSHSYKEQHYISKLSTDHKPDIPYEKERIEKMNGEVYKEDFDEPYRVWCKGKEYPGIAMSRSIGDAVAKEVGVCYKIAFITRADAVIDPCSKKFIFRQNTTPLTVIN